MFTALYQVPDTSFVTSIMLDRVFVSGYAGSDAVELTNGGGHRAGLSAILLFPAGTATSLTVPWELLDGSDSFSVLHDCALFLRALSATRIVASLKRVT